MTLIKQNDPRLLPEINQFGCRFRCLQAIAEYTIGRALTCEHILEAYDKFLRNPTVMNANCRCRENEHLIIDRAFLVLGRTMTGRQIGRIENGQPLGWTNKKTEFDFMIVHWETKTKDGHFTLYDDKGAEIFDPWDYTLSKGLEKIKISRQLLYNVFGGKK